VNDVVAINYIRRKQDNISRISTNSRETNGKVNNTLRQGVWSEAQMGLTLNPFCRLSTLNPQMVLQAVSP
jgi:hypothetical protein